MMFAIFSEVFIDMPVIFIINQMKVICGYQTALNAKKLLTPGKCNILDISSTVLFIKQRRKLLVTMTIMM